MPGMPRYMGKWATLDRPLAGSMEWEVERLDPKALARSGFAATRWGQRVPPFSAGDFRGQSESDCIVPA